MTTSPELILHYYPTSPYAQKVLLALAIKKIPFKAVKGLTAVPQGRPITTALTGGYRKIPVLQIGADIFCDTYLILEKLEELFPSTPSLVPTVNGKQDKATAFAYKVWSDKYFFPNIGPLVPWEKLPKELTSDREKFMGSSLDVEKLKLVRPFNKDQVRVILQVLNEKLSDGKKYLLGGEQPTHADVHMFMGIWFLKSVGQAKPLSDGAYGPIPHALAWYDNLNSILATATKLETKITPQEVFEAATKSAASKAQPITTTNKPDDIGRVVGGKISVTPDDTGRESVVGTLVSIDINYIVVRCENKEFEGKKVITDVHLPRVGFVAKPVSAKL